MARSVHTRIDVADLPLEDEQALERALPSALVAFAAPMVRSRAMLALEDDWDGEGSPRYDESTWRRAVGFLLTHALAVYEELGVVIPAPKVGKGPHGSIDLHWRPPGRHLLMNIPVESDELGEFYGNDGLGGQEVKGSFDPGEEYLWLMMWLTNP